MTPAATLDAVQRTVLHLIRAYGLVAVFAYMLLETSLLLHFVPSEVVVPFAAALLVRGPLTFLAFVVVATAGATVGSVVAYRVFGENSTRLLERYGRYVHVSESSLDRWQRWFRRWGETSVFWGRLLPVVRSLISVPAGAAGMDLRRFVIYSAAGSLLFNVALTYLVYAGERSGSVVRTALQGIAAVLLVNLQYVETHPQVVAIEIALLCLVGAILWWRRRWIREHPGRAKHYAVTVVRMVGIAAGLLVLSSAVSLPDESFAAITWVWNDPRALLAAGLSPAQALLVLGTLLVVATVVVTEAARRIAFRPLYRRLRGSRNRP
ncbi:MAG: DedA family protein [Haloarculaceae archaeon]